MPRLIPSRSTLAVIDLQTRLIPALLDADVVLSNTRRLLAAAGMMGVPVVFTEQNPKGLGPTVPELMPDLALESAVVATKMAFDATSVLAAHLPPDHAVILAGCEAHVCVLQTALGLMAMGREVHVVEDAVGSRTAGNKAAGLRRLERHGADIITTEMAVFEWMESATHPRFRDVIALIR
ncbi:isochorismatase family protein [Nitrospirillum sp. BR 11828]|uniref:isochorismatase family protein n=1 Tax=Nitrospirillum sp. BR 11828 TaxID=3104325 RepID=UPI002ACAEE86|nr:isochorismatase family protein [Nitrospirillum sp. BR 11828]MDZ5648349.1 isochorismatase family protein [Nitrospirillum sp. BR 11828]